MNLPIIPKPYAVVLDKSIDKVEGSVFLVLLYLYGY